MSSSDLLSPKMFEFRCPKCLRDHVRPQGSETWCPCGRHIGCDYVTEAFLVETFMLPTRHLKKESWDGQAPARD